MGNKVTLPRVMAPFLLSPLRYVGVAVQLEHARRDKTLPVQKPHDAYERILLQKIITTLTRNYYENNSLRIIFRNFRGKMRPQNLRERKTFSRNYA